MNRTDSNVVLAQRYAYATVALVVGLLSFVNLFGFEKSILAPPRPQSAREGPRSRARRPAALGEVRHCARRRSDRAGGDRYRAQP